MKQLSGYGNVNTQTVQPTPSHPHKQAKQSSDSTATLGLTVKLGSHSLSTLHHNLPSLCNACSLACTHARTHTAVNESTATRTTTITATAQVTPLWRGLSSLKRRWIACARSLLVCCSALLSLHSSFLATNTPKSSLKCFSHCPLSLSLSFSACPALPLARGVVTPFCSIDF